MKHFIALLKSPNGKPVEIRLISAADNIASIELLPHVMNNDTDAAAYKLQLEQFNGIFSMAQARKPSTKRKSVKDVSTGQIFPSATAAAASVSVSASFMVRSLKAGNGHTNIKGHVFAWLETATLYGM